MPVTPNRRTRPRSSRPPHSSHPPNSPRQPHSPRLPARMLSVNARRAREPRSTLTWRTTPSWRGCWAARAPRWSTATACGASCRSSTRGSPACRAPGTRCATATCVTYCRHWARSACRRLTCPACALPPPRAPSSRSSARCACAATPYSRTCRRAARPVARARRRPPRPPPPLAVRRRRVARYARGRRTPRRAATPRRDRTPRRVR